MRSQPFLLKVVSVDSRDTTDREPLSVDNVLELMEEIRSFKAKRGGRFMFVILLAIMLLVS
jgi:hypothetical protein